MNLQCLFTTIINTSRNFQLFQSFVLVLKKKSLISSCLSKNTKLFYEQQSEWSWASFEVEFVPLSLFLCIQNNHSLLMHPLWGPCRARQARCSPPSRQTTAKAHMPLPWQRCSFGLLTQLETNCHRSYRNGFIYAMPVPWYILLLNKPAGFWVYGGLFGLFGILEVDWQKPYFFIRPWD